MSYPPTRKKEVVDLENKVHSNPSIAQGKRKGSLTREQVAFDAQVEDLMRDHAGEFVVFHGGGPVGFWATFNDAYRAALKGCGLDEIFLVDEVRPRKAVWM